MNEENLSHIVLTSHVNKIFSEVPAINWGAPTPKERGPVLATLADLKKKNAIGTHSGSYTIYRAISIACGELPADHTPDFTDTSPIVKIGPYESWKNPENIVSLDPWGATAPEDFAELRAKGMDIRPSMAITSAHIDMPEIAHAIARKRIKIDGKVVVNAHSVAVTKVAMEPVWYLPGMAKRFNISEADLRKSLYKNTGGIFPELITRTDLKILLPPIGSSTVYIFGDLNKIPENDVELTVRVHDECNGSDVFGSDICTCRPYLVHGIEECIKSAQRGGTGVIVYFRKEGRALGEVTKFLVYNARKRQTGGDSATNYFKRTECIAGVEDMRFQQLMPDVLHWLGIQRIQKLISMSDLKYDAIVNSGIKIDERVRIPDHLIPEDAHVEIAAKKAAGYFTEEKPMNEEELDQIKGRKYEGD